MAFLEFLLIGILALLIIGPKDFPKAVYNLIRLFTGLKIFYDHYLRSFYSIDDFSIPLNPVNQSFEELEEVSFFSQGKFFKIDSSRASLSVLSVANQDRF